MAVTDQPGLSIFESASLRPEFPVVRRGGYDREAVDDFTASAQERIAALEEELA